MAERNVLIPALVVFHGKGCGFWPWLCGRPGFRHCFAALNDGRVWIVVDARGDGLRVTADIPADFDLAGHYRGLGYGVVEAAPRRPCRRYVLPWAFTCVETVKRAFFVDSGLSYEGAPTATLTGLDHLEGETVAVLADGALHPDRVVADGAITLQAPASVAHVGQPYRHVFTSLKLEAGARAGTAVGRVKRVHGVVLVLLHSLGLKIGPSLDALQEVALREVADAMDGAVPLFTGEQHVSFLGDFARDVRIVIAGSAPLPFTLLAVSPELKTNELL